MDTYDIIFVGGGHNALLAAAYLAGAGRSVLVLDRNDRAGGFVRTDEIAPGFRADTYSAAHPLFLTGPVYRDLRPALEERGLRHLDTDLPSGVSLEDGTTAVMPRSTEAFVAEADRLAPGDGAVFGAMLEALGPSVADVFSLFALDLTSPAAQEIRGRLLAGPSGPNLYTVGASTWPGGGVSGASGYIVAQQLLAGQDPMQVRR